MVTITKFTVHVLKTCGKTTAKNMADYVDEIISFLLQLPTEFAAVMQSVRFTNDLNVLEYWYGRLEYAVNVLKLIVERVELFQQDFASIDTIVLLL